ncbi:ATP10 protein-domain-containing protein [Lophiotrema nucula]|uniref:ATP10 protein-domain-containing protein n=1 Tax=Lophiotrema nucula TaxID=690887 RepID=A0A6A5ZPH5_9PLEO|nr:ATP10 protein-domain-containing protein [Lophiotrema nucula]
MLQPRISSLLSRKLPIFNPSSTCLRCQHTALRPLLPCNRTFSSAQHLRADAEAKPKYVPKSLGRPIGFRNPPKPGENTGVREKKTYTGTLSERNLQKRADLQQEWGQNYFRDAINIRKHAGGKTFKANPRLFRREVALHFPNLRGATLKDSVADTTNVLRGKISIVKLYGAHWGKLQVDTFTRGKNNPELEELLEKNKDIAQAIDVNVEENMAKRWLTALFHWRLRKSMFEEEWGKYFIVKKGVNQAIREAIGCLNGRVGYVYLLDQNCRIRWAGSGDAEAEEIESLNRGLGKLIDEARGVRRQVEKPDVEEELEAQAVNAGAS